MTEPSSGRIILCQPDNIKGCSLCCGLFNFGDITSGALGNFLQEGKERESKLSDYEGFINSSEIRDEFSHICPYQGFLSDNKPGCLVHPLYCGADGRGRSLFASKICSGFFCPAHSILSEEEKRFLINNVTDWYLYSVAIADPESYSFIYNYVKQSFNKPDSDGLFVKSVISGLMAHAENLAVYQGIIFCYSIPEYNLNKKNFCIRYVKNSGDRVVSRIDLCMSEKNIPANSST